MVRHDPHALFELLFDLIWVRIWEHRLVDLEPTALNFLILFEELVIHHDLPIGEPLLEFETLELSLENLDLVTILLEGCCHNRLVLEWG